MLQLLENELNVNYHNNEERNVPGDYTVFSLLSCSNITKHVLVILVILIIGKAVKLKYFAY